MGWASWFYAYKAFLPLNLTAIYPKWNINASDWRHYVPAVLLAACLIVFFRNRATWGRALLFGSGYFVVTLFPVLGFFDQNFNQYSLVADHWQYYSIVGVIAVAVGCGISLLRQINAPRYLRWFVAAALTLAFGFATWSRTHVYANSETLWRDHRQESERVGSSYESGS